jgi:hypothetical protein
VILWNIGNFSSSHSVTPRRLDFSKAPLLETHSCKTVSLSVCLAFSFLILKFVWHSEDCALWYILIIKPTRFTNFWNLFWNRTVHVSDSFSVHHQESSTVHTAIVHTAIGICHTGYADCLLASSQHNLYVLLCVQY